MDSHLYVLLTILLLILALGARVGWLAVAVIIPLVIGVSTGVTTGWSNPEGYGYPNAYVTGYLAGGTVYAKYPHDTPGLGWIL